MMDELMRKAVLKPASVPGNKQGVYSCESRFPLPMADMAKEFPGIDVREELSSKIGAPMSFSFEIRGPIEQIEAFILKYGNNNLKMEAGFRWDGKAWVKA